MKFDSCSKVEEVVWRMRLADLPRADNRNILNTHYNGMPPFDEATAEENAVEVNRNFLIGTRVLSEARRQWMQAFLKPGNFFTVLLDDGPKYKRQEWGSVITKNLNRILKRSRKMIDQVRATGANTVLHGIAPVTWESKSSVIPVPLFVGSLMVPSETDVDFSNLSYFGIFREYTPAMLYDLTHGPKTDPGWNMPLVMDQMKYVGQQVMKSPNSVAYQYMPERVEELIKQDGGYWGSDAVPTIDAWDFYFRQDDDGAGWYRRIFLDWGIKDHSMWDYAMTTKDGKVESNGRFPESKNKINEKIEFLYSSGERAYAQSHSNIIHCQFGDCSAVAPFKYHSVRSLGWMLWGMCDLMNRMQCRFTEAIFQQLMWFFRVAGQQDMLRLKKADFYHMGVIPQGVSFVPANERFIPNAQLLDMGFSGLRQLISENAASFTQDFDKGQGQKELTATEVMARVNSVNAMVGGMMTLAYTYEEFKYREICRRFCIPDNQDADAKAFRLACLKEGVPAEYLDSDRWEIQAERVLGQGNKTLEMATVQFLQSIRKNLGPDAQRKIDHISIDAATDQPDLAEDLAPIANMETVSDSMNSAENSTARLMIGLPYQEPKDAVYEDYVKIWLRDMAVTVQLIQSTDQIGKPEQVMGLQNMANHVARFLEIMAQNDEEKPKVTQYADMLTKLMNLVKGFAQRQAEMQQQAQPQGDNGDGAAKIQAQMMMAQVKAKNAEQSHAQKTAQRQIAFEMEQERKDRETDANIQRTNAEKAAELRGTAASDALELHTTAVKNAQEMEQARQAAMNEPTTTETE